VIKEIISGNYSSEFLKIVLDSITKPKDIAKMCSFIVNNNQSMTGQNIIIDGGYSLRNF